MANPTLTHGQGYLNDLTTITSWSKVNHNMLVGEIDLTLLYEDKFRIEFDAPDSSTDNEWGGYALDLDAAGTSFSTTSYPYWMCRYKTSESSLAMGAQMHLDYSTDKSDFEEAFTVPQFSTTWKIATGTFTTGKTFKRLFLLGDDYPDTVDSGASNVFFDFFMAYKDTFTFPQWDILDFYPRGRFADIGIPSRVGDITQNLGSESAEVHIAGKMEHGQTWTIGTLGGDATYGAVILKNSHRSYTEPWNWFTSDLCNMKATLRNPRISQDASSKKQRTYDLVLKELRASCGSNETWEERFGLNL